MAAGRLGTHKSTGTGTAVVYTVPSGKTAEVSVVVANTSAGVNNVTLYRSPTGTPSATHTIQLDSVPINGGYERSALILSAGERICYTTDQIGTHVTVMGVEYSSKSNEIKQQELITTNTETVIYSNTASVDSVVNVSISLQHGSGASDLATCELYVSATDAASGVKVHKFPLTTAGVTGFEKTALFISSTDKVILVTTSLVGGVASTVQGYKR